MLLSDTVFETFNAINANKIRSGLTILGIVIGIASVIAMLAIGTGAQKDITDRIQGIGSNLVIVRPGAQNNFGYSARGGGSADTLTIEDADLIQSQISLVKNTAPVSSGNNQVISSGNNTNTNIYGVTSDYALVKSIELSQGNFITDKHSKGLSKVAVLGPDVAEDLFGENFQVVGEKIKINGTSFLIIGITESKGSSGMNNEDSVVYIPLTTYQQYMQGNNSLSMINLEIIDVDSMSEAESKIETLLLNSHGIKNPDDADFNITNQSDIVEMASSATKTFTVLLGAVASISLIVGGIGIMNMMLTSVTERTREIGLRKSIGAKGRDISRQFLLESIVLTFFGGIIGIIIGIGIAWGVSKFSEVSTSVSGYSIILAFGVSALIGIVFGYYPAKRASKLNPIDALRYE